MAPLAQLAEDVVFGSGRHARWFGGVEGRARDRAVAKEGS